MRDLADGGYIDRAEPVLLIGDCGTGKTHLLSGLCVAACKQKRRVRFTTAAALVNELVEAKHQLQPRRVMARWSRYDLIAIDEAGYVPLAEVGAEFLFQVDFGTLIWSSSAFYSGPPSKRTDTLMRAAAGGGGTRWIGDQRWSYSKRSAENTSSA